MASFIEKTASAIESKSPPFLATVTIFASLFVIKKVFDAFIFFLLLNI